MEAPRNLFCCGVRTFKDSFVKCGLEHLWPSFGPWFVSHIREEGYALKAPPYVSSASCAAGSKN